MDNAARAALVERFRSALAPRSLNLADLDPGALARHLPLLSRLDSIEGSSVAVYDMHEGRYAFLTGSFRFLGGLSRVDADLEGPAYLFRHMHPDDLPVVIEIVSKALRFLDCQKPEARKEYKLSFDFRMEGPGDSWVHLVQQVIVLEQDGRGAVWLVLIVTDREGDGSDATAPQCRMTSLRDGSRVPFGIAEEPVHSPLSPREREVLGLVAEGRASKEIADRLCISVATVNNHRRRILEKTGARNSLEAVRRAHRIGLA